MGMSWW